MAENHTLLDLVDCIVEDSTWPQWLDLKNGFKAELCFRIFNFE